MNKHAVPLADSDAFELEDLGVVPPGEYVVGIYKDFLHWDVVREGSRILLLTPERLIAIRMISPEQGERTEFRWTEINRLSFMHQGKQGLGLVISIGLTSGEIVRFMLRGPGVKYSRDQFVQTLLETMDKRLGGRDSDRARTSAPIRPAGYASQFRNRPSFRSAALFHAANGSRVVDF